MKLRKSIAINAIAFALAGQISVLTAQAPIDQLDEPIGLGVDFIDEGVSLEYGRFHIIGGSLYEDPRQAYEDLPFNSDEASLSERLIQSAVNLAGMALDVLIPSVHAADVTITDNTPALIYDDTLIGTGTDWQVEGSAFFSNYRILDLLGNNFHQVVDINGSSGSTLNQDSIVIDADGDIHWADGRMNFDKSDRRMVIGATVGKLGFSVLELHASLPQFLMYTTAHDNGFFISLSQETLSFNGWPSGGSLLPVMGFHIAAPEDSLYIDSSGNIGNGTHFPTAALEVIRFDGTAQILVNELSQTTATRTLFSLKNSGLTKFFIERTDMGVTWAFANKGTSFRISRQGSGAVEMEVFNNGNVTIDGALTENSDVHAKTNIEPIDQRSILARITAMPISQWQYKDALGENHIGPMAQDFYAAFGLGATETGISSIDTAGVALAAIQALASDNKDLRQQIQNQKDQLQVQNDRLEALELQSQRVDKLEVMVLRLAMSQAETTLVAN